MSARRNSTAPLVDRARSPASSPAPRSIAPSQPITTHMRKAMWASISRSDGQALDAENANAKITASPVRMVAKNATLTCVDPITRSSPAGCDTARGTVAATAMAAAHRPKLRCLSCRSATATLGTSSPSAGYHPVLLSRPSYGR